MQLRSDLALPAMIKSLSEVVLPAVDPQNQPAIEQLQVTIGLLNLLAERLPLEFRYDRDELERLLGFARALAAIDGADADAVQALATGIARGSDVLERARATPREMLESIRELRSTAGALVTAAYAGGDAAARNALEVLVLEHADAQLLRERAWLAPQGWEAGTLPAIGDLI